MMVRIHKQCLHFLSVISTDADDSVFLARNKIVDSPRSLNEILWAIRLDLKALSFFSMAAYIKGAKALLNEYADGIGILFSKLADFHFSIR